jgi:RNA polymerase sigma factor (sigma-70 family)
VADYESAGDGSTALHFDDAVAPESIGPGEAGIDVTFTDQLEPATAVPVEASEVERVPLPEPAAETFETFFRANYRTLLKQARYAGADEYEADDATAATMADVYEHWRRLDDPAAWARRAVVRFYWKAKTRNLDRIRARQVRHGVGTPQGHADKNMTSWEEWQWINQMLLNALTCEQRDVMALVLDGYSPTEVAGLIGTTPQAVRQRLSIARRTLITLWTRWDTDLPSAEGGPA